MIVRRRGGMTEFIPSPQEKRDGIIRDHTLGLLENLHRRLESIESLAGLPLENAQEFFKLLSRLRDEENHNLALHIRMLTGSDRDD